MNAITRIPLTIISTLDGATTDGVLVGVLAADLDTLEQVETMPTTETQAKWAYDRVLDIYATVEGTELFDNRWGQVLTDLSELLKLLDSLTPGATIWDESRPVSVLGAPPDSQRDTNERTRRMSALNAFQWVVAVEPSFSEGQWHWAAWKLDADGRQARSSYAEGDEPTRYDAFTKATYHAARSEKLA